eukprot:15439140-Alexandrium_andersonii.AAC.1
MGGTAGGPGGQGTTARACRQRRAKPRTHVCGNEAHGGHCKGGPGGCGRWPEARAAAATAR